MLDFNKAILEPLLRMQEEEERKRNTVVQCDHSFSPAVTQKILNAVGKWYEGGCLIATNDFEAGLEAMDKAVTLAQTLTNILDGE